MFKKIVLVLAFLLLVGLLVFGAVNRSLAKAGRDNGGEIAQGSGEGYHGDEAEHAGLSPESLAALPAADPGSLTDQEIAGLLFMREEEKLAHDVYMALYDLVEPANLCQYCQQ